MSGTYPWNGPWAKFELNWSRTTSAAMTRIEFEVAIPIRNTRSRVVPMRMNGLRRPKRLIV